MEFSILFVWFFIVLLKIDVEGTVSFEAVKESIFCRDPEVNRVRHIEDAQGDEYAVLDTVGLVEKHGYPAEQHEVTTKDGYNIVFFRIPGSPKSPPATGKPVVFMQHGFLASSDTWVLIGPKSDLAFLLADAGYDVWLGNLRGNTYGRSHQNFTTSNAKFWNFSFHELGLIDLPTMIDYSLEHSGQKSFFYVGYSMGATISLILLTEKPEYNEKMLLNIAFGPVAFWKKSPGGMYDDVIRHIEFIEFLWEMQHIHDLAPLSKQSAKLARESCSPDSNTHIVCLVGLTSAAGTFANNLNSSVLSNMFNYYPAGTSTKTIYHFAQNVKSGLLEKYDYGSVENLKLYGSENSPSYDMTKITTPVAVYWGKTDVIAPGPNIEDLAKRLKNVVACEAVAEDHFNHVDFLVASRVKELVYDKVMQLMSKYLKN